MKRANDGMVEFNREKLIELNGFMINGEVLLSDSEKIGEYEKVKVKVTPGAIKHWIRDNVSELESIADVIILEVD